MADDEVRYVSLMKKLDMNKRNILLINFYYILFFSYLYCGIPLCFMTHLQKITVRNKLSKRNYYNVVKDVQNYVSVYLLQTSLMQGKFCMAI